jgi:aminotransferase EvaB
MNIPFYYLDRQFEVLENAIIEDIRAVARRGDFTLGTEVEEFEKLFAARLDVGHAIGVNSGTDALKLSLKALGVSAGDEVITSANTFIATVGAIAELGAVPVFVDCDETLCTDVSKIEAAITAKTRAIVPVHMSGAVVDMTSLTALADRYSLPIVEDACQAFLSERDGKKAGTTGRTGAFSLHPMKFVNIWGDGGVIVTNDSGLAAKLRLLRNHGLQSRDNVVLLGCNSRLDTVQAVVAKRVLAESDAILGRRQINARLYDAAFAKIPQLVIPRRTPNTTHSFVTYQVFAKDRDALLHHCNEQGLDCKVHYPIPVYRHKGLEHFGYKLGDFPVTDAQADTCMTFPVHQFLNDDAIHQAVSIVQNFYRTSAG